MKTPLRIALLGCGGMGSGHALAISGEDQKKPEFLTYDVYSECQIEISPLADKLELAGIYDIDEARMRWVAEKGWHCYGSYEEILNDETVDAVLIATPNHLHKEQAIRALRAGKHVLCEKPVMLYSIGKDSSVMLHLARKAFYPENPPFPFLHIDTTWKFHEMIEFRDATAKKYGLNMLVYTNMDGVRQGINPFDHGAAYTDIMKTQALKAALKQYGFTAAFGGGRRDEEKSRAKERIFSFRSAEQTWDPKNQRPEMWKLYNTRIHKGESIRVFPLSNWTEADIWQYIKRENIEIVSLYYARERPCIYRDGNIIMVDDDRLKLRPGEKIEYKKIRFRTLGCYPLTGGMESDADTLDKIIAETLGAVYSERTSRVIDHEAAGSMERRKREGYF